MTDKAAVLIHNSYLDGGTPTVVVDESGFCPQEVALHGARHKHHVAADAEGQVSLMIHQRRHREVSQRKQRPTLTRAASVQVLFRHRHLRNRMHRVHLGNPATGIRREAVGSVQYFLYVHS